MAPSNSSICPHCSNLTKSSPMVRCDVCPQWYHFTCVGVDESIKDRSWLCSTCVTGENINAIFSGDNAILNSTSNLPPSRPSSVLRSGSFRTIHSSKSSQRARTELELQRIQEEYEMVEKMKAEEAAEKIKRYREFMEKKYNEKQKLVKVDDYDESSLICEEDVVQRQKHLSKWVDDVSSIKNEKSVSNNNNQMLNQQRSLGNCKSMNREFVEQFGPTTSLGSSALRKSNEIQEYKNNSNYHQISQHFQIEQNFPPNRQQNSNQNDVSTQMQMRVTFDRNYEQNNNRTQSNVKTDSTNGFEKSFESNPLMQSTNANISSRNAFGMSSGYSSQEWELSLPSKQQMIARKSMNTDLPIFDGRAEDWTCFISSYEMTTYVCGFNNMDNLIRLKRCLKGEAYDTVRHRLNLPRYVPEIIDELRKSFGQPATIIAIQMENIRNLPPPKAENLESVIKYSNAVRDMVASMESSGHAAYLCDPTMLSEVTHKLPITLKYMWLEYKANIPLVTLATYSNWLREKADTLKSDRLPVFMKNININENNEERYVNTHSKGSSNVLSINLTNKKFEKSEESRKCRVCRQDCVNVYDCKEFKSLAIPRRWDVVKANNLCRTCLRYHKGYSCKVLRICGVNNCEVKHHQLLHSTSEDSATNNGRSVETNIFTHQKNDI